MIIVDEKCLNFKCLTNERMKGIVLYIFFFAQNIHNHCELKSLAGGTSRCFPPKLNGIKIDFTQCRFVTFRFR